MEVILNGVGVKDFVTGGGAMIYFLIEGGKVPRKGGALLGLSGFFWISVLLLIVLISSFFFPKLVS